MDFAAVCARPAVNKRFGEDAPRAAGVLLSANVSENTSPWPQQRRPCSTPFPPGGTRSTSHDTVVAKPKRLALCRDCQRKGIQESRSAQPPETATAHCALAVAQGTSGARRLRSHTPAACSPSDWQCACRGAALTDSNRAPSFPAVVSQTMFVASVITLIRFYQRWLSPDTGLLKAWYPFGCCRFSPTCSEFMLQSLLRQGLLRGLALGMHRILRCHPWQAGGYDPVR